MKYLAVFWLAAIGGIGDCAQDFGSTQNFHFLGQSFANPHVVAPSYDRRKNIPPGQPIYVGGVAKAKDVERLKIPVISGFVVLTAILLFALNGLKHDDQHNEDKLQNAPVPLPEDSYGFIVASLINDSNKISKGSSVRDLRVVRICSSVAIAVLTFCLQTWLIYQIKQFVTAKWVHDIRVDYDEYELTMYGREPGHTTLTSNGKHRGVDGYFQPQNFQSMSEGLKGRVCSIPFSQPQFFMLVILMWTLVCVGEMRVCFALFRNLVLNMPTVSSMRDALASAKDYPGSEDRLVVNGLTRTLKVAMMVLVVIPRLIVTFILCWLGSRFLAATNDFCEMVLNAIALEFILLFKNLLWNTIIPERNKQDTAMTVLHPVSRHVPANPWHYLVTFVWLWVAMGWVVCYTLFFQQVLPEYNWDVKAACSPWLKSSLTV
jgi:hypothetical protein